MINTERRKATGGLTKEVKFADKLFPTKGLLSPLINDLMFTRPWTFDLIFSSLPLIYHSFSH